MSRNCFLAATVLAGAAVSPHLASAQPVTGLYIGAGAGANFMEQQQTRLAPAGGAVRYGRSGFDTGVVGLGNVGWGFGNGVRVELEGNYRRNDFRAKSGTAILRGREQKYGAMANALFDLDIGSPYVFPYIGAGVGYASVDQRGTTGIAGGRYDGSKGGFAYQAIAGVSLPVPWVVGLSLTGEYRYFAVSGARTYSVSVPVSGTVKTKADFNHDLIIGLRYAFNVVPPPPPPPAVVAPAPAPEAARTFLVFFDWDRADLTDRARQVIAEAAQATTRVQVTRIEVNGHTDTSGTAAYNRGLSIRRAQNVANELVRLGVPRQAISVQGFGETRPLVPTADGVREPQNRRVEIILR